jgi:hypothetical protein
MKPMGATVPLQALAPVLIGYCDTCNVVMIYRSSLSSLVVVRPRTEQTIPYPRLPSPCTGSDPRSSFPSFSHILVIAVTIVVLPG